MSAFCPAPQNLRRPKHGTRSSTPKQTHSPARASQSVTKRPRPRLLLAPMEVLGDRHFRLAQATVGGADEAVHEFIRVTAYTPADIRGVLKRYDARELGATPLAAQIMGSDPAALAAATHRLVAVGAPRVDLNCGCPARRVNGRGAGASLLLDPCLLRACLEAMVRAAAGTSVRVSAKIRAGYADTSELDAVVGAVADAGAEMVTLHARTKTQGYSGRADWALIARAKRLVGDSLRVVGNGDVVSPADAVCMLQETGCDDVMIGRGAVANPWLFWDARDALARAGYLPPEGARSCAGGAVRRAERGLRGELAFWHAYLHAGERVNDATAPRIHKYKIGRLKMLLGRYGALDAGERERLRAMDGGGDARVFMRLIAAALQRSYADCDDRDAGLVTSSAQTRAVSVGVS